MDTKIMKAEMDMAFEAIEGIELIDKAVEEIKENGVFVETKFRKSVTMFLDDKTKDIIRAIVVPQLEEKREELVKYIDEKLTGGIVK